jgi:hypothetical protein
MTRKSIRFVRLDDDEAFRQIGRYVVLFSELVSNMRERVEHWLAGESNDKQNLVKLAFGPLTANGIAEAFFALCRSADLDADEQKIEKLLREK